MMEVEDMTRMFSRDSYGIVGQLCTIKEEQMENISGRVLEVVHQFAQVFEELKELPPPKSHDHYIPLKEGAQPFKVRPFRCPFIKKIEIERLVPEMLKSGII